MGGRSNIASAAIACLALCSSLATPATPAVAQNRMANDVTGTWSGSFAQTDWTFEIRRESDTWSGRYMSAKTKTWQPMQSLTVSARKVRFSMNAQPPVSFDLELDPSAKALTGDVNVFGRKLPFSAARKS